MAISFLTTPLPLPVQSGTAGSGAPAAAATLAQGDIQAPAAVPNAAEAPGLSALQTALTALRQSAVTKQDGMAGLLANALQATADSSLPPPVLSAVQQLTQLALPTNRLPSAADIKAVLASSGLFTESDLAKGKKPNDLKSALGALKQAAQDWAASAPPGGKGQIPRQGPSVPPPMRGGQPVAQATAAPTLPQGADAAITAELLADGSEAALARQDLLQLASLPEDNPSPNGQTRWVVDVPLMTPQGPATAQMMIERDGRNATADAPEPVWRVALALNVDPLGPVRANLALAGDHAWVTLAADKPTSLDQLQRNAGWLTSAMHDTALEADIAFQPGAPPRPRGGYKSGA